MTAIAALVVGALVGFVASRSLRRPQHAAQAASVARTVGGSLGRRRGLTAPELQRACFSEMVRHVRVDRSGRSLAPSRYLLQLHPDDLSVVDETHDWFADGLAEALQQAAADNGWALEGAIDIQFEADPNRRPGVPNALAVDPEASKRPKPTAPPPASASLSRATTRLALRRVDTGDRTALGASPITIGRSSDCTVTVVH